MKLCSRDNTPCRFKCTKRHADTTTLCVRSPYALPHLPSALPLQHIDRLGSRGWVHLPLATCHCDIDEATGVSDSLLRSAFRGLLLLLGLNLCLAQVSSRLDLQYILRRGLLAFGVCDLTLPARAREPCTLPIFADVFRVCEIEKPVLSLRV